MVCCRSVPLVIFALILNTSYGAKLEKVELLPGKDAGQLTIKTVTHFVEGERRVPFVIRAAVLAHGNGRDFYVPVNGKTESQRHPQGWWQYSPGDLLSRDPGDNPYGFSGSVEHRVSFSLEDLDLPPREQSYSIEFHVFLNPDQPNEQRWALSPGVLNVTAEGKAEFALAKAYDKWGRPQLKAFKELTNIREIMEWNERDPRVPSYLPKDLSKIEKSFQPSILPRDSQTPEDKTDAEQKRKEAIAKRAANPLDAAVDEETFLIYFATNRPLQPVTKDQAPWKAFLPTKENYVPTKELRLGAVAVENPLYRIKGLYGKFGKANGTPEQDAAADNFIKYIWGEDCLVYVHGFNVDFEEAVLGAAELKTLLRFKGPVIAIDWASYGETLKYFEDEKNAYASLESLALLFPRLTDGNLLAPDELIGPPGKIHWIVHSMGNRVFLGSLGFLNLNRALYESSIGQVILAAPDIGQEGLIHLGQLVHATAVRTTLYYSFKDIPLYASFLAHLGEERAGRAVRFPKSIKDRFDLVDVNKVNDPFVHLGHSAYAVSHPVLRDIKELLKAGTLPADRGLRLKRRDFSTEFNFSIASDWEFPEQEIRFK